MNENKKKCFNEIIGSSPYYKYLSCHFEIFTKIARGCNRDLLIFVLYNDTCIIHTIHLKRISPGPLEYYLEFKNCVRLRLTAFIIEKCLLRGVQLG